MCHKLYMLFDLKTYVRLVELNSAGIMLLHFSSQFRDYTLQIQVHAVPVSVTSWLHFATALQYRDSVFSGKEACGSKT